MSYGERAPDAADAVRRITERRAQFAGGLSLVDSAGEEASIVEPPPPDAEGYSVVQES